MCTYAIKEGIAGVLMHEDYAICYKSKKLNKCEKNYATHHIELASIIDVLKMWHHDLIGRRFILLTNNIIIKCDWLLGP